MTLTTSRTNAGANEQYNGISRRKRLGQFFTGLPLARLLSSLCVDHSARAAIDPMAGVGDMLIALHAIDPDLHLYGIEIDPDVGERARSTLSELHVPDGSLIIGNAFDYRRYQRLPSAQFDLVITNPPYVRYQSLTNQGVDDLDIPSGSEVRTSLVRLLEDLPGLTSSDRRALVELARNYSGLADLAVPSWLLCAALTRVGGYLGIVVPESWLSRDYADPIKYLLTTMFDIEIIVEDIHRAWFKSAQVKTMLVVAKRRPYVAIHDRHSQGPYLHVGLPRSASTSDSIVGKLFPDTSSPEAKFTQALRDGSEHERLRAASVELQHRSALELWREAAHRASRTRWYRSLEKQSSESQSAIQSDSSHSVALPAELVSHVPELLAVRWQHLADVGIDVGQGLRTGANSFFYVEADPNQVDEATTLIRPSSRLSSSTIRVPSSVLRPVLRRQSELGKSLMVRSDDVLGRLLVLEGWIHPDDLAGLPATDQHRITSESGYRVMPAELAEFVSQAASTNIGSSDSPRFAPNLSAVRTNASSRDIARPRFWYTLPPLARRHLPLMFVARVNTGHPLVFVNADPAVVIDANFSSFWRNEGSSIPGPAVFALLNSTWSVSFMEAIGSVLGGGALKLEATHIRRLPVPILSEREWRVLSDIGQKMLDANSHSLFQTEVDNALATILFGDSTGIEVVQALSTYAEMKLGQRRVRA